MINTTLMGTPSNAFGTEQYKFVVRTFYLASEDIFVTDVYHLQEEEHYKNINVIIPADTKEEVIANKRFDCRYPLTWICSHRTVALREGNKCGEWDAARKKCGDHHLEICKEILDGEYWFGYIAIP